MRRKEKPDADQMLFRWKTGQFASNKITGKEYWKYRDWREFHKPKTVYIGTGISDYVRRTKKVS